MKTGSKKGEARRNRIGGRCRGSVLRRIVHEWPSKHGMWPASPPTPPQLEPHDTTRLDHKIGRPSTSLPPLPSPPLHFTSHPPAHSPGRERGGKLAIRAGGSSNTANCSAGRLALTSNPECVYGPQWGHDTHPRTRSDVTPATSSARRRERGGVMNGQRALMDCMAHGHQSAMHGDARPVPTSTPPFPLPPLSPLLACFL